MSIEADLKEFVFRYRMVDGLDGIRGDFGKLRAANQQLASTQQEIASLQRRQADLQQQQLAAQRQQLAVQQQQLAVQQQQLAIQELSLIQQEIQTKISLQQHLRRDRQRELKNAAFIARQSMENALSSPDPVAAFVFVALVEDSLKSDQVEPNELEELADKEYVKTLLNDLGKAKERAAQGLGAGDLADLTLLKDASGKLKTTGVLRDDAARGIAEANAELAALAKSQSAPSPGKIILGWIGVVAMALLIFGAIGAQVSPSEGKDSIGWGGMIVVVLLGLVGLGYFTKMKTDPAKNPERAAHTAGRQQELVAQIERLNGEIRTAVAEGEAQRKQVEEVFTRHPPLVALRQQLVEGS